MTSNDIYSLDWTGSVKITGRAFVYNNCLWLSHSGTGIGFVCNDGFRVLLCSDMTVPGNEKSYARVAVLKDGVQILDERVDRKRMNIEIRDEGVHTYTIVKLTESAESTVGILELEAYGRMTGDDGTEAEFLPSGQERLKMEIIGDSISCGYGVEGEDGQEFTTATENFTKAWPYLAAKKLNAEYSLVARSGAGVVSGYTDTGERNIDNIISYYYDFMGCTLAGLDDGAKPLDFEYDFSMEPDIIVIMLGTNDISYVRPVDEKGTVTIDRDEENRRRKEFYVAYKKFLKYVRSKNPLSRIVCTLGVMGTDLNREVVMAVDELCAEGDQRIFRKELKEQDPADGYGTNLHPSAITQRKTADELAEFIYGIQ